MRIEAGWLRSTAVVFLMVLLILPVYLPPLAVALSEFQASQFVGTLLIFDGHSLDHSVNREAYFLSEATAGNQSITFIQFQGKPPPPQAADRLMIIQGQKVIRPEDHRLIISATGFTLLQGVNSTRSSSGTTATTTTSIKNSTIVTTTNSTFDYAISISPGNITISPGQTVTYYLRIGLVKGPTQLVSLGWNTNTGLPAGTSVSITPNSGNPPYNATLAVATPTQAAPGAYGIAVSGFAPGVGLTHVSSAVMFRVLPTTTTTQPPPPAFDFYISNNIGITAMQGGSGFNTISVNLLNGTTQSVTLSCTSGLPSGASCSFNPQSSNPTFSSALTINTSTSTPTGSFTITVTGTGGGKTRATSFTLTVNAAPPAFGFSLSNSGGITVVQGSSSTNTITAALTSGSTQSVSLSCTSGLPSNASCSFNPQSGNPTYSSTLTIHTSSTTPTGSYSITVTGTGGSVSHTTQFTLTVNPFLLAIGNVWVSPQTGQVAPTVSEPQGYVTFLVKFGDVDTMPHNAAFYTDMIYGSTGSTVNSYFQENSYGSFSITGQVFGDWRTLSTVPDGADDRAHFLYGGASGTCGPNDDGSCLPQLLSHVMATFPDANFNDFDRGINVELNDNIGSICWGSIGNDVIPLQTGSLERGVTFMSPWCQTPGYHGHEIGHGLRWVHSGLNYDDPWSQMSGGTNYPCITSTALTCPSHSHGEEKEKQGWMAPNSILTPSSPDVTINLMRLESLSGGTMLIKVPISCNVVSWSTGDKCTLYLETRMRYGFDSNLPGEGVVITKYTDQDGDWLLRPVRTDAWQVGEVYSEGGLKVSILGSGADYFTVRVQIANANPNTASSQPGGGCLIATATYGSELSPEVQFLRSFRDESIMRTYAGSNFMVAFNAWYYSFSPYVAAYISTHSVERTVMKGLLYPLIGILQVSSGAFYAARSHPELAALLSGLVASSLIGAFYLGLSLSLLRAKVRFLRGSRAQRLLEKSLGFAVLVGIGALLVGEIVASPIVLTLSSSAIVLSTLFLSAAFTSAKIAERLQNL